MKILVTGDAHGNKKAFDLIKEKHHDIDLFIDAGDSVLPPSLIAPFLTVRGNCDFNSDIPEHFQFMTPFGKLYVKHIPNISTDELKKMGIKIFIYGHLHRRAFYQRDGIYFISPGSLTYERDEYKEGYVILDIDKDKINAQFIDL